MAKRAREECTWEDRKSDKKKERMLKKETMII